MLIYASQITSRLRYAVDIIFENYEGKVSFTNSLEELNIHKGPKIAYSEKVVPGAVHIVPHGLINASGTGKVSPEKAGWHGIPAIFPTEGEIPFDIFSAVFFLLSRYEEYGHFEPDGMGRFEANQSINHRYGFLGQPVVDQWRKKFSEHIHSIFPAASFRRYEFRFISTIDIDSAFAFRYKGLTRTLGAMVRDVFFFRLLNFSRRISSVMRLRNDPYDVYHVLEKLHASRKFEVVYFFLLSDFGKFDKNVPHSSTRLRDTIRALSLGNKVGIHPGVGSNDSPDKLLTEVKRLESITGQKCSLSRQHYLILHFPDTYRRLIAAGITDDYTMGYAQDVGFRAGTSGSFRWYDLQNEICTSLVIHPFAAMDATLNRYLKLKPAEALTLLHNLHDIIKEVDGTFTILWHNESLSETGEWKGWRGVYENFVRSV